MQNADLDRAVLEVGEIARDRVRQPFRAAEQILGGGQHAVAGRLDAVGDGGDFRQHAADGAGDLLGAAADAIDLGGLVIEDAGQLPVGLAHGGHARRHAGDCLDRLVHRVLDVVHLGADIAGGLGGLLGERFDLRRDHGKSAAGSAGTCRLDCGVERQERSLRGDRLDQFHHRADTLGGGGEAAHGAVGALKIGHGTRGGVLGGGGFGGGLHDQRQQPARGIGDRGDVTARRGGGIDRMRGALAHIDIARTEIGGGDLDFLGRGLKHADELVDRGAKALGEEAAAGMVQPRFRLPAAVIDRQRVGIDQNLPHLFRRHGAVAERAAAYPFGQRGIAVAACDLGDGADHAAQHLFAPPRHSKRADQRRDNAEEQASGAPGDQDRDRGRGADGEQNPGRHGSVTGIGGHLGFWREKSWRTAAKLRIFDYQNLSLCCVAAHE